MNRAVLLGAVLVVLLTLLASCTEGLKCVHCGWNFEPCCTPFPPPTECEVGDKSCFMGVYKHKLGKKVHEMRGCHTTVTPLTDFTYSKAMPNETSITESYCPTDGCNSGLLPTQITKSPFTYTVSVSLLCIQCGWGSAVPCSRPLPPPISCRKEQKSCFHGTVTENNGTTAIDCGFGGQIEKCVDGKCICVDRPKKVKTDLQSDLDCDGDNSLADLLCDSALDCGFGFRIGKCDDNKCTCVDYDRKAKTNFQPEQEMRGCHTSSGINLWTMHFANGTHIKGTLCDWAECNSDPPPAKPTPPPEPAECEPLSATTVSPVGSSANPSPVPTSKSVFTCSAALGVGVVVALLERR